MRTLFLDVDTQIDFVNPSGALYVPGASAILPAVARLNQWAIAHGHQLISTADAHSEDDPEFRAWPPHCVLGTLGQRKPEQTQAGQTVTNKLTVDCFESPAFQAALEKSGAGQCFVYGVVTEICVANAALGLLKTGRQVAIVMDAVKELDPAANHRFIHRFTALGGQLTTLEAIIRG